MTDVPFNPFFVKLNFRRFTNPDKSGMGPTKFLFEDKTRVMRRESFPIDTGMASSLLLCEISSLSTTSLFVLSLHHTPSVCAVIRRKYIRSRYPTLVQRTESHKVRHLGHCDRWGPLHLFSATPLKSLIHRPKIGMALFSPNKSLHFS